ncbi:hypothetical protein C5S29_08855 [ANME-1 cluster archaeon GoMg3.2]|nr:hypothetical protein [ANME-1 cluster archaeon GoMg3.2]
MIIFLVVKSDLVVIQEETLTELQGFLGSAEELNQRLKENITYIKQDLIREIHDNRLKRGNIPIPQSTL